jgi:hypothetical protein
MKTQWLLGALCLSLATTACNDVLGNNDGNFAFEVSPINYDPALTEGVEISPLAGAIQLDGLLVLPHSCHEITGDHRQAGTNITFTVTARASGFSCPAALAMVEYRAQSLGLSRGSYHVRVEHKIGTAAARVIAEDDVTVN